MNKMIPAYKKMLEIYSAPTENKEYYQEVFDRSPKLFFDALTESEHISKASVQTFKDAVMIYNKEGDFTGEYFSEPLTEIAEHFGIERNDTNEKFFHSEAREDIKTAYDLALERLAKNCRLLTDNSKEYLTESYLEDSVSEFFDAIESKACMTKAMRCTLLDYVTVYESGENYHEEDTDKMQDILDACGLTKDYIAEYIVKATEYENLDGELDQIITGLKNVFEETISDFKILKGGYSDTFYANALTDYLEHQDMLRVNIKEPYCKNGAKEVLLSLYDQRTDGWNVAVEANFGNNKNNKLEELYKTNQGYNERTFDEAREIFNRYSKVQLPSLAKLVEISKDKPMQSNTLSEIFGEATAKDIKNNLSNAYISEVYDNAIDIIIPTSEGDFTFGVYCYYADGSDERPLAGAIDFSADEEYYDFSKDFSDKEKRVIQGIMDNYKGFVKGQFLTADEKEHKEEQEITDINSER